MFVLTHMGSKVHDKNVEDLKELLLSKLQTLLRDKASAGVSNNFGETLISKGAKFNTYSRDPNTVGI